MPYAIGRLLFGGFISRANVHGPSSVALRSQARPICRTVRVTFCGREGPGAASAARHYAPLSATAKRSCRERGLVDGSVELRSVGLVEGERLGRGLDASTIGDEHRHAVVEPTRGESEG
jgi:hypothetical protein